MGKSADGKCTRSTAKASGLRRRSGDDATVVRQDTQLEAGGLRRGVKDSHRRAFEIRGLCLENVRDERLRIAVGQRKPRALNLDHDAMALLERVIDVRHRESQRVWLVRNERDWFGGLATIPAAEWLA